MLQFVQAFVDDSKSERDPPFFVLGGYVATAQTWTDFSTKWQQALEMRPRIKYFKLREAVRGIGEFYGASEALRQERIGVMRGVIELFHISGFSISFRLDHLTATHADLNKYWLNPYYTAVTCLMPELARGLEELEMPRERLDIVFDNQDMEKTEVLRAWEHLRDRAKTSTKLVPPDILSHLLVNSPRWDDDKDVLPLQAADMQATWVRMSKEAEFEGLEPKHMPNARRGLKQLSLTLDRDYFKARRTRILAAIAEAKLDEP